LVKQQLAFRDNDERTTSSHPGNYVELLQSIAENEETFARHLEPSTVFSDSSKIIQNDLIEAISDDIREIHAVPFVAPEVDETKDA